MTADQRRRLASKIRAVSSAQEDLDAYVLDLNEEGVSVRTMADATAEAGDDVATPRATLHRWVARGRLRRDGAAAS